MKKNITSQKPKANPKRLQDYEPHLRGFSTNRWGGHQNSRLRGYGNNYGPASQCHTFTEEQKAEWLKAKGLV